MAQTAKQGVIPGTLNRSQVAALRAVEDRDAVEIAKARYQRSLDALAVFMERDNLAEVYAKGTCFRREVSEKIVVKGYTKPDAEQSDDEDTGE